MLPEHFVAIHAIDGKLRECEGHPFHVVIVRLANDFVVDILK